jgi:hypothetical protein
MKNILILFTLLLLSGCSLLPFAKYDGGEYQMLNTIVTETQLTKTCSSEFINQLKYQATEVTNYSTNLPNNTRIVALEQKLTIIVNELASKQTMSDVYCQTKLNIIHDTALSIQKASGKKL